MTDKRPYATDVGAGYTTDWMVPPPPLGSAFQITQDEWRNEYHRGAVRRVWAWRALVADAPMGMSPLAYASLPRWRRWLVRLAWWRRG